MAVLKIILAGSETTLSMGIVLKSRLEPYASKSSASTTSARLLAQMSYLKSQSIKTIKVFKIF